MAKRLTATTLENLKAKPNGKGVIVRAEYPDERCPGLYLVVQPNGAKSWAVRFRSPVERDKSGTRKAKKLTLGPLANAAAKGAPKAEAKIGNPLTLTDARALATASFQKIDAGFDPTHERRAERSKHKENAAAKDSVEDLFTRFMDRWKSVV